MITALVIWSLINLMVTLLNWRKARSNERKFAANVLDLKQIELNVRKFEKKTIEEAQDLLTKAREIVKAANIENNHRVCTVCSKITTRHMVGENGAAICVDCASTHLSKGLGGITYMTPV
jgi:hypothetical protein